MIKVKKVKPLYTAIVTTADKYTEPQYLPGSTIIDPKKTKTGLKEYQVVKEVGSMVKEVKVGDLVCINPQNYAVKKYESNGLKDGVEKMNPVIQYNFNILLIDDEEYLMLQERDIDFILEEYEEVEDSKLKSDISK